MVRPGPRHIPPSLFKIQRNARLLFVCAKGGYLQAIIIEAVVAVAIEVVAVIAVAINV